MTPEDIKKRIWKSIENYPDYQVSACGLIRSTNSKELIKQYPDYKGYLKVRLYRNKEVTNFSVHRLVIFAFIGKPKTSDLQVGHINGVCNDNRRENLKWCTPKENQADRVIHGTDCAGERGPSAKLTPAQVRFIKSHYQKGTFGIFGQKALAKKFGVTSRAISYVVTGETWKKY